MAFAAALQTKKSESATMNVVRFFIRPSPAVKFPVDQFELIGQFTQARALYALLDRAISVRHETMK